MKLNTFLRGVLVTTVCLVVLAGTASAAIQSADLSLGVGRVFFPNPVAFLQDQSLTDQDDADYEALQDAYVEVELTNLDGSGYLRGDWANIYKSVGPLAYSPDNLFLYDREDDRFEQVMGYYWVTEAQKYIQSLGFKSGGDYPPINEESQDIRINQLGLDNSWSFSKQDVLRFGKGGVDDAEDAEVILHEYGHSMLDAQSDPFGSFGASPEAGAIHEGFADYWAVTVTDVIAPTLDPACVADWDSVSYTPDDEIHCLRRVDYDLHYPEDLEGQVHHDGMIWSRALWDILGVLGHQQADTLILKAQFDFAADSSMPDAARVTVATAGELFGKRAERAAFRAFKDRGILP